MPSVGVFQELHEFLGFQSRQVSVETPMANERLCGDAIDAAIGSVDTALKMSRVVDALFVKVGDVDGTVRPHADTNRPDPCVGALEGEPNVFGAKCATGRDALADHHVTLQRCHGKEFVLVAIGQADTLIDDECVRESRYLGMRHVPEITEGIGIRERSVFGESFLEIPSLDIVEASCVAAVVAGKNTAFGIELDTERVTASFGEDLIHVSFGVVTPNQLSHRADRRVVTSRTAHFATNRAALGGIEPSVGSPREAVDDRVRILETEAFEVHFGRAVGTVVAIAVGVEEEVGRIEHPDAATTDGERCGDVQAAEESGMPVVDAVPVGVFVDGDAVLSWRALGRRKGGLVVDRPEMLVATDRL